MEQKLGMLIAGFLFSTASFASIDCHGFDAASCMDIQSNDTNYHLVSARVNNVEAFRDWVIGGTALIIQNGDLPDMVAEQFLNLGPNNISFAQCADDDCAASKLIGSYDFKITQTDTTYDLMPNHYTINLDSSFGTKSHNTKLATANKFFKLAR